MHQTPCRAPAARGWCWSMCLLPGAPRGLSDPATQHASAWWQLHRGGGAGGCLPSAREICGRRGERRLTVRRYCNPMHRPDQRCVIRARESAIVHVVSLRVRPPSSMPRTVRAGPPLYTWSVRGSARHRACPIQCAWVRHCTRGQCEGPSAIEFTVIRGGGMRGANPDPCHELKERA